jgi:hypothetical protein
MKGELINRHDLLNAISAIFTNAKTEIRNSHLSREEQDRVLAAMADFEIGVAQKRSQARLNVRLYPEDEGPEAEIPGEGEQKDSDGR